MRQHKDIEQEVKRTLESLDDVEDIEVNPYFYTHLQARIHEAERQQTRRVFGTVQLRLAGVIALLVINLFAFVFLFRTSRIPTDERQAYMSAFADEYGFTQESNDLFDL